MRWEKTTRPFLRSREILWQEGHTMHQTEEEARKETLQMFHVYENFQRNYLALPVICGRKTEKEKFAGAEETYTIEAMMYDGYALQNGTSHYFGQKFAKSFHIEFLDSDNTLKTPYQTSWGVSTRMIGGIIMTHADDHGLVLPPKIAPIKVMFVPIKKEEKIMECIHHIVNDLNQDITYKIDDTDKSPGFKFAECEVKGIPIRIEVGLRDLEEQKVTLVRRDTLEKIQIDVREVAEKIGMYLDDIQKNMYDRAKCRRDAMIYEAHNYDEFKEIASTKPGFIKINWCGNETCEEQIKSDTGFKSRCIIENEEPTGPCAICEKTAKHRIYFGKQY